MVRVKYVDSGYRFATRPGSQSAIRHVGIIEREIETNKTCVHTGVCNLNLYDILNMINKI